MRKSRFFSDEVELALLVDSIDLAVRYRLIHAVQEKFFLDHVEFDRKFFRNLVIDYASQNEGFDVLFFQILLIEVGLKERFLLDSRLQFVIAEGLIFNIFDCEVTQLRDDLVKFVSVGNLHDTLWTTLFETVL